MAQAASARTDPQSTAQVLLEEAIAIHGADRVENVLGRDAVDKIESGDAEPELTKDLYRALHELAPAALCLSGGGIRSAAFALGVVQALAAHPRPADDAPLAKPEDSLLAKFHYLSSVSGGGYIGGWLSAWIARAGFTCVWRHLVGRPQGPDVEPPAIAWLRSYSNYLTPKLGLTSADTWAAVAIVLRNLILNWFVILPVLCLLLLAAKSYALLVASFSQFHALGCDPSFRTVAWLGAAAVFVALAFTHTQRPAHCDGRAGQRGVLLGSVLPATLSGVFFSLALASACAHDRLYERLWFSGSYSSMAVTGLRYGAAIYLAAWIVALPFWRIWRGLWTLPFGRRSPPGAVDAGRDPVPGLGRLLADFRNALPSPRAWLDVVRDLVGVVVAGAVYGVLIALGVYLYLQFLWDHGYWKFERSEIFLVVLAVPWALLAQLLAEMIFVGLTSWEKQSDADREWLGRAAGSYIVVALAWGVLLFLVFLAATVAADLHQRVWAWIIGAGAGAIAAWLGKSRITPARGPARTGTAFAAQIAIAVAAVLFAVLLVVVASAALDRVLFGRTLIEASVFRARMTQAAYPDWPGKWAIWKGIAIAAAVGLIASYYVNINRFSLHALYRNRLIRAFLGASHIPTRRQNPYSGFDSADNLRMHQLWPPEDMWDQVRGRSWQPFHVINIALNIVSTKRLAWQERKAESFTASALHTGTACGRSMVGRDGAVLRESRPLRNGAASLPFHHRERCQLR